MKKLFVLILSVLACTKDYASTAVGRVPDIGAYEYTGGGVTRIQ